MELCGARAARLARDEEPDMLAGFARTFGTLLQSGVPHLDALGIVRDTSASEVLIEGVEAIRRTVREGEGIAQPMQETGLFDDLVCSMVDVGEQTGELDGMLTKIADRYETEVDQTVETTFKLIEPILLVVMAVVVGFIMFALFMPLLTMMQQMSKR